MYSYLGDTTLKSSEALNSMRTLENPLNADSVRRLPVAAALLLATTASLITGCSRSQEKASPARGKAMPVPVTVAVVTQTDVPIELRAIGTVHAYASVSVRPLVDGQLGQVGFKQGDEV